MQRILFLILLTAALNSNAQTRQDAVIEALEAEYVAYNRLESIYGLNTDIVRESSPWFSIYSLRDRLDQLREGDDGMWQKVETELHFWRRSDDWRTIESRLRDSLRTRGVFDWKLYNAVTYAEQARRAWEHAEYYRLTGD